MGHPVCWVHSTVLFVAPEVMFAVVLASVCRAESWATTLIFFRELSNELHMYVSPQTDQGIGPYHVTVTAKGGGQRGGHFGAIDCNLKVSWDIKLRYFKVR